MTYGRFKSKIRKRTYVKTSTGTTIFYSKPRKKSVFCVSCNSILQSTNLYRGVTKSQKRPSRPFGGVLCAACVRDTFRQRARLL